MKLITFQDPLDVSSVPLAKLGDRAVTPDGRRWVYTKANEALTKHHLAISVANTDVDTVSSSTNDASQIVYITEGSAGWTVGQFADAWGCVDDGTGEGQIFKVKDNTTDTLELYVEYRLTTAMAVADSDIVLVRPHLVRKVLITTLLQQCKGFAQVAFAANDYGWLLEGGVGGCLPGAALVQDELITPGDDTAGEVIGIANGETPDDISIVGRCVVPNTTADKAALAEVTIL